MRSRPTTTGTGRRDAATTWKGRRSRSGHNCPCPKKCGLASIDSQEVTTWTALEDRTTNARVSLCRSAMRLIQQARSSEFRAVGVCAQRRHAILRRLRSASVVQLMCRVLVRHECPGHDYFVERRRSACAAAATTCDRGQRCHGTVADIRWRIWNADGRPWVAAAVSVTQSLVAARSVRHRFASGTVGRNDEAALHPMDLTHTLPTCRRPPSLPFVLFHCENCLQ